MNKKELKLIADLLIMADEEFSNHGCNDIDSDLFENWSEEEKKQLVIDYHTENGDIDEIEDDELCLEMLGDSSLMWYMSKKIINEIKDNKR